MKLGNITSIEFLAVKSLDRNSGATKSLHDVKGTITYISANKVRMYVSFKETLKEIVLNPDFGFALGVYDGKLILVRHEGGFKATVKSNKSTRHYLSMYAFETDAIKEFTKQEKRTKFVGTLTQKDIDGQKLYVSFLERVE